MGLNPLNLIRVMPAKERELAIGQVQPSPSSAPASPASPARSSSPSAASAVEVVERGQALGEGSLLVDGGRHAGAVVRARHRPSPRSSTLGRAAIAWWAERFPGTVRNGSLVVAQPREAPDLAALCRAHRALRMGSTRSASPRSSPISPAASAGRCSFADEAHLDPRRALRGAGRAAEAAVASRSASASSCDAEGGRRRHRRRLPRACRARRAARPARREGRDAGRALARGVAGAAGAAAASAHPALHRAARRRRCS